MIVVEGVGGLTPAVGRVFVVVGAFDGLHRGHAYLLEALAREARRRAARPTVLTFDHHPDEILTGRAPALLLDPAERLERLAAAGIEITIVHHFDQATRRTPFDAFVRAIAERVDLAGFLMTPESAFGFERGGTAAAVASLGRELDYEVVVIPTLALEGQPVRSTDIRAAIAAGDLATAGHLLGRRYAIVAETRQRGALGTLLPVALPPAGRYAVSVDGLAAQLVIDDRGALSLGDGPSQADPIGRVRMEFGPGS